MASFQCVKGKSTLYKIKYASKKYKKRKETTKQLYFGQLQKIICGGNNPWGSIMYNN